MNDAKANVVLGSIIVVIFLFLAWGFQAIWNLAVVSAISSTNEISYFQAMLLFVFINLFLKAFPNIPLKHKKE